MRPGLAEQLKNLRARLDPDVLERLGVGTPTSWFCARHEVEKAPCLTCNEVAKELAKPRWGLKQRTRGQG